MIEKLQIIFGVILLLALTLLTKNIRTAMGFHICTILRNLRIQIAKAHYGECGIGAHRLDRFPARHSGRNTEAAMGHGDAPPGDFINIWVNLQSMIARAYHFNGSIGAHRLA